MQRAEVQEEPSERHAAAGLGRAHNADMSTLACWLFGHRFSIWVFRQGRYMRSCARCPLVEWADDPPRLMRPA
jgi:hypothetical protein